MDRIKLTQSEYTGLSTKDTNTNYLITKEGKLYKGENQYWKNYEDYSEEVSISSDSAQNPSIE